MKAYRVINSVSIDTPGIYYYPLIAAEVTFVLSCVICCDYDRMYGHQKVVL